MHIYYMSIYVIYTHMCVCILYSTKYILYMYVHYMCVCAYVCMYIYDVQIYIRSVIK